MKVEFLKNDTYRIIEDYTETQGSAKIAIEGFVNKDNVAYITFKSYTDLLERTLGYKQEIRLLKKELEKIKEETKYDELHLMKLDLMRYRHLINQFCGFNAEMNERFDPELRADICDALNAQIERTEQRMFLMKLAARENKEDKEE